MNDRIVVSIAVGFICLVAAWLIAAVYVWLDGIVPFLYVLPIGVIAAVVVFAVDVITGRRK